MGLSGHVTSNLKNTKFVQEIVQEIMTQKVQEIMTHDVQENMTQKTNLLFVQEIVQRSFDEAIRLQVAVTPPDSQGGQQLKRLRG